MGTQADRSVLARKHLERRLSAWRGIDAARPPKGWVRAIRDAFGMTAVQMAARLGVVQSRITALEQAEANDAITLKSLRQAAEALDCTLVYALVPNEPIDDLLRDRAARIADEQIARAHHSMRLEDQALDPRDLAAARTSLVNELLHAPRRLWDQR
ncbi:mobile mystery protein A [Phenylobacterium sp.]|uniref:mobile mystery protein A n=1 Tax=Phenylobacterium sp. TaxID=1871053 RepID=UPI002FCA7686